MLARALLRAAQRLPHAAAATLPPVTALRPLCAAATAPPGGALDADDEVPHPFTLEVLRIAKWRFEAPALAKRYEFRTPRDAGRFDAQVRDLALRAGRLPGLRLDGIFVDVTIPYSPRRAAAAAGAADGGGGGGGAAASPTAMDVALAQAVDAVGAELQLAGKWGAG